MARVRYHHRVGESSARWGRFGASGSSLARFVPKIRPFEEKKRAGINNLVYSKSWLLLTAHFGPVLIVPSQWSISAVLCYKHRSGLLIIPFSLGHVLCSVALWCLKCTDRIEIGLDDR